jgi:hypothetical protein
MKARFAKDALSVVVAREEYPVSAVKHAAFSLTEDVFAALEPAANGVRVVLRPKRERADLKALLGRFAAALSEEELRDRIEDGNVGLRDHIVALALRGEEPAKTETEDGAELTPEQEKELDRLVAEVEAELGKESSAAESDPSGVVKTWEETQGSGEAGS